MHLSSNEFTKEGNFEVVTWLNLTHQVTKDVITYLMSKMHTTSGLASTTLASIPPEEAIIKVKT